MEVKKRISNICINIKNGCVLAGRVQRLFENDFLWGGGGEVNTVIMKLTHPYSHICFVVFFKKFFPFMYVNSPNGFFGQICNPEISSKPI